MKRLLTGGVLAGLFLFVGAAHAATLDVPSECSGSTSFLTVTQQITEGDTGQFGNWATDTFTETANVYQATDGVNAFCAVGTINSGGTFTTTGPKTPGADAALLAGITGTITGGETWVFPAGTGTTTAASVLTATTVNTTGDSQFSNWQHEVFGATTGAHTFTFTYIVDGDSSDTWTNADINTGNITNPSSALSTVYVDGVNGNDTANIGSQAAPLKTLGAALNAVAVGGTVNLASDITLSAQLTVSKAVTIDGSGHTLHATFAKTDNTNNAAIGIFANNVTVKNLIEDGTGSTALHGINIFQATGVTLDGVTLSHNGHAGAVVNGSVVTANNITTSSNAWGGIDVDLGSGVTGPATLTVTGVSHHTEALADIWIDDVTKNVSVVDTNNQYVSSLTGNTKVYKLKTVVTSTAPEVVVTNPTQPVNVTIDPGTTNATINFDSLITNGTGTLPETNIDSATADVAIPAATIVTSTDANWDGVISAPTVTTAFTLTADAGQTASAITAVEIGAGDTPLTFSKAVKLTFTGQAGNLIGWSQAGTFHAIATDCSADSQATGDALADGADCRIDVGADLVVWTKHFSTFVTYTQAPTPVSSGTASGNIDGHRQDISSLLATNGTTNPNAGQVLGAFTTADNQAQIALVKQQLVAVISQLIALLQQQLVAMQAQGSY